MLQAAAIIAVVIFTACSGGEEPTPGPSETLGPPVFPQPTAAASLVGDLATVGIIQVVSEVEPPAADVRQAAYVLVESDGQSLPWDRQISLLVRTDSSVAGFAGCNGYLGTWFGPDPPLVEFDVSPYTDETCVADDTTFEAAYLERLGMAERWDAPAGGLTSFVIHAADGSTLTFEETDPADLAPLPIPPMPEPTPTPGTGDGTIPVVPIDPRFRIVVFPDVGGNPPSPVPRIIFPHTNEFVIRAIGPIFRVDTLVLETGDLSSGIFDVRPELFDTIDQGLLQNAVLEPVPLEVLSVFDEEPDA